MNQMRNMCSIEIKNILGINVFKHTKNPVEQKRMKGLLIAIVLVILFLVFYIGAMSYGFVTMGAGEMVPSYLIMLSVAIVFGFSAFQVGGILFRSNGYQVMASLPVKTSAIVAGRFARLYLEGLAKACLVMIPGNLVYAFLLKPGWTFYVNGLVSILILPMLPLSAAVFIGVLVTGFASRMKHRAIWEALLTLGFVFVILGGMARMSGNNREFTLEMLNSISETVIEILEKVYPPAVLLGEGMTRGSFLPVLFVAFLSVIVLMSVMGIVTHFFHTICRKLQDAASPKTRAISEIGISSLGQHKMFGSLVIRDARRYLASSPYMLNTIMGPVLGTIGSVALLFTDIEKATVSIPIHLNIRQAMVFLISGIFCTMNTTSTSVSMEGKEWWILKSLPLPPKMILDSKLCFNLLLIAPFYLISQIFLGIALRGVAVEIFWSVIIMALFILCSCVGGLTANLKFPKMEWDSETVVVKQSASAAVGGLSGMLVAIFCGVIVMTIPAALLHVFRAVIVLMLTILTTFLYRKNMRTDLRQI